MWQLAEFSAGLSLAPLEARINVLEPWSGVVSAKWFNRAAPASLAVLQIDLREFIAPNQLPLEVYSRGIDIVASYAPSEGRNVQTQVYWRGTSPTCGSPAAGVELILSVQTHLLDSRPHLSTVSTLPGGEVFSLQPLGTDWEPVSLSSRREWPAAPAVALLLFRPHGVAFSYAEMVHPSDFAGATLEQRGENSLRLTNHLFPDRLEKGVIRRGRICGLFLSRQADLACAMAAYRAFIDEPLPLTA